MSKKKKIILLLLICVLLLLVIVLLLAQNKQEEIQTNTLQQVAVEIEDEELKKWKEYFRIKNCIERYLESITAGYYAYNLDGEYTYIRKDDMTEERICNILSKSYKNKNNVTEKNVLDKVQTVKGPSSFVILDMEELIDGNLRSYKLHGIIEDMKDYTYIREQSIMLNIDTENNTFSVEPIEADDELILTNNIEKNDNNELKSISTTEKDVVKEYVKLYKQLAIGYPEIIYNYCLDKEYRDKKFESIEEFKEYINNNKENIKNLEMVQYQINETDRGKQYILIDQNENYYFVYETDLLKYKFVLDDYTTNSQQFLDKYNIATEQVKVALNIQKLKLALNTKDYEYIYNHLDETFRNNNFATVESFKEYAKQNFYNANDINFGKFFEKTGYYIYNISIVNKETAYEVVEKEIIMKLGEDTEFIFSFNV